MKKVFVVDRSEGRRGGTVELDVDDAVERIKKGAAQAVGCARFQIPNDWQLRVDVDEVEEDGED